MGARGAVCSSGRTGATRKAERHRRADDEQKQRHDQVPGGETDPARMRELALGLVDPWRAFGRDQRERGEGKLIAANDPEHIEAAESVER